MTKNEALTLALEALELPSMKTQSMLEQRDAAITAIKEALAQPEQESVKLKMIKGEICYLSKHDDQSFGMWCPVTTSDFPNGTIFYTTPPQRPGVGLTDGAHPKQKPVVWCSQCGHKCPQIAQQEPVAWWDENLGVFDEKHFDQLQPLYTTPPQRPWAGLTGQAKALIASVSLGVHDAVHRTEAKLKEKNT